MRRPRHRRSGVGVILRVVVCCLMALFAGMKIGQLRTTTPEAKDRRVFLERSRFVSEHHSLSEISGAIQQLRGSVDKIHDRQTADAAWRKIHDLTDWLERQQPVVPKSQDLDVPKSELDVPKSSLPPPPPPPPREPVKEDAKKLDGSTVVVVICFERADLLRKCLEAVVQYAPCGMRIVISQDGGGHPEKAAKVAAVADAALTELRNRCGGQGGYDRIVHTAQSRDGSGYHKLARHFHFALSSVFDMPGIDRAIVLEEDLVVAPDFFTFFGFVAPLLDTDSTLLAASAWNDNGQRGKVKDPTAIVRSDFFPGLGWMLTKAVWTDLEPKWPAAYWDDWLREPAQRRGRHILRPEICRTFHLTTTSGTSHGQYSDFLTKIHLYDGSSGTNFGDPARFDMERYDAQLLKDLQAAVHVNHPSDMDGDGSFRLEYVGLDDGRRDAFPARARALGVMDNMKAGVPRTAYRGVVAFWMGSRRVYLAPPLEDVERRLFRLEVPPR